jgi:hypothetical protein
MDLSEMERRLKVLEDIEEIKKLQVHYVNCLINTNWDELTECFSKNGTFSAHAGDAVGKKAIKELFIKDISKNHIGQEGLFVVHPIISVDGDKAKGSWLLYTQIAQPRKFKIKPPYLSTDDAPDWTQGFYEIEYVKEDGQWKIYSLKWRMRLISPMTSLKEMPE